MTKNQDALSFVKDYQALISSVEKERGELHRLNAIYGVEKRDTFNFFETLGNYHREQFHDIVLSQILNPRTTEIGNIEFLHIFCDLLGLRRCRFDNTLSVENQAGNKDYGFIDILVCDASNAIIIENKINRAPDQPDQLARYYDYVKNELGKNILAIVYLRPLGDESKLPPFDEYSKEYGDTTQIVKNLLVPLSVIDKSGNDLCHGFLDKCAEISGNLTAKIYIRQYSQLLKNMGGRIMVMETEKEIFKKLFADNEGVRKMADIGRIWDERPVLLGSVIHEALITRSGFEPDGDQYTYKQIAVAEIKIAFFYDTWNRKFSYAFGFAGLEEKPGQKKRKVLEGILSDFKAPGLGDEVEAVEDWALVKRLDIGIDKPLNQIVDEVLEMYRQFEEKAVRELQ
jgi:hypothetical protein